jgi:1-acyl-sn-glycerol-3-phosphate acyltransferase
VTQGSRGGDGPDRARADHGPDHRGGRRHRLARWASERDLGWRIAAPIVSALLRLPFRVRLVGAEHLPRRGPALVVANHISSVDPLLLAVVFHRLGRHPRFVGLVDLWDVPVTGFFVRIAKVIPVRRGEGIAQLADPVCDALEAGHLVVVYPEGTVAAPGEVTEGRPGVGDIALRTTAPLLPLAQWGHQRGAGWWPPLRRRVAVVVGAPVPHAAIRTAADETGVDPGARRVAASTALLAEVNALLPRARAAAGGRGGGRGRRGGA